MRNLLAPALDGVGRRLSSAGVAPVSLTALGWLVGVSACVAAGFGKWHLALALWLGNRMLDGLDGPTARATAPSDTGGFLDLCADFSVYAGFVVGVAVAVPPARVACVALLAAYYLSGTAFLALASLSEKRGLTATDGRSLRFVGGLAEGTETVIAYVVFALYPSHAEAIAWVFCVMVAITAAQRVVGGLALLNRADEGIFA